MNNLKVTTEPQCAECADPIEYKLVGRVTKMREWLHANESRESLIGPTDGWRGHCAYPVRKCADCGGPITDWQDAWADYSGCKACGTETRTGIGD